MNDVIILLMDTLRPSDAKATMMALTPKEIDDGVQEFTNRLPQMWLNGQTDYWRAFADLFFHDPLTEETDPIVAGFFTSAWVDENMSGQSYNPSQPKDTQAILISQEVIGKQLPNLFAETDRFKRTVNKAKRVFNPNIAELADEKEKMLKVYERLIKELGGEHDIESFALAMQLGYKGILSHDVAICDHPPAHRVSFMLGTTLYFLAKQYSKILK